MRAASESSSFQSRTSGGGTLTPIKAARHAANCRRNEIFPCSTNRSRYRSPWCRPGRSTSARFAIRKSSGRMRPPGICGRKATSAERLPANASTTPSRTAASASGTVSKRINCANCRCSVRRRPVSCPGRPRLIRRVGPRPPPSEWASPQVHTYRPAGPFQRRDSASD